jgi:hypothetical protein
MGKAEGAGRIGTETSRKEIGIRKLLIELEERGLQWLDHEQRNERREGH